MTNPTSSFGWQMPTNTDLVTDLPADFEVFGQAVDTSMADLLGGTTGQILAKNSNTNMDFVWITNDVGDITAVNVTSPITGGGTSGAVTVGIQSASTSQSGAVQLSDSTSTTSSVLASTPTATKAAYDLAAAAVPKSTVTAKGSIFTATASATPAQIAVGNNGESLVADSSTSTGLRYNASANANLIAGGSFDIWQRGVGPFTASGVYTSDRCYVYSQSSYSLSQESSVVPEGATYAAKVTATAGSSFANLQFALEQSEVEKLAGKTVTFSVYLRANATYNGSFQVQILTSTTGNSQTATWAAQVSTSHTPSTSAYTRVTVTATIPTTAKGLAFYVGQNTVLANGSIYYIGLAKAELGSVATPFVRAGVTLEGELASCQRYYFRNAATNNSASFFMNTFNTSTTGWYGVYTLPVTMRTKPTVETSGTASHYRIYSAAGFTTLSTVPALDQANESTVSLSSSVASGLTAGQGSVLAANGTSSAYLGFTAEL